MSLYDTGTSFGRYAATTASRALVSMILWGVIISIIQWAFRILFFWLPIFYSDTRNRAIARAEHYFKNNCQALCQNCNYWVPQTSDYTCPVCGASIDVVYKMQVEAREAGYTDVDKYYEDMGNDIVFSPSKDRWHKKWDRIVAEGKDDIAHGPVWFDYGEPDSCKPSSR